jgi:predicted ATPase with chaperone activity
MATALTDAAQRLQRVIADACRGLVGREVAVQLVVLAAVAREHMLLVGPPGTAKSEAVRRSFAPRVSLDRRSQARRASDRRRRRQSCLRGGENVSFRAA